MDFCTSMHMKKSNEWTLTISHCLIVNCTTIWLTAYLLCPGFGEAHVCQGVQGRQVLSVDLGWGWIFSRWQQCGHIAALQWFWLLVCWVNGLGLELTYWGLGVSCVRTSHDYHWVTLCSYVFLFLICEEVSLYPWVEERGESDLRVEQTQVRERERELCTGHQTQYSQLVRVPEFIQHKTQSSFETCSKVLSWVWNSIVTP